VIAVIAAIALATGCKSAADQKKEAPKDPASEVQEDSKRLYTGSGEATVRDPDGERPIRYVLRWKETQLDYTLEKGPAGGKVTGASGEMYREGKLASRFTADSAVADKANNLLTLQGNVVVNGMDPKARLKCQKIEWKIDEKLFKAFGKVTIKFKDGTIGPVDELWCLPDLERAGTPGFYAP
jgi:hypothetical protein